MIWNRCLVALLLASPAIAIPLPQESVGGHELPRIKSSHVQETLTFFDIHDIVEDLCPPAAVEMTDGRTPAELRAEQRSRVSNRLLAAIRTYMKPAWSAEQNTKSVYLGDSLAMSATKEQNEWIGSFLANLRQHPGRMLGSRVVYFEVPRGQLSTLGVEGPTTLLVAEGAREKLIQKAKEMEGVHLLMSPEVILRPISDATVSVQKQVAYIKSYEIKMIEPGNALIADPVIDTISEGYVLKLSCTPLPGGLHGTSIEFNRTAIERPIPTRTIRLATAPESEGTISSPVVTRVAVKSDVLLGSGQSIAFSTPANDDEKDLLVIVTLTDLALTPPPAPDEGSESGHQR